MSGPNSLRRKLRLCLISMGALGLAHCGSDDDGGGNATGGIAGASSKGGSSGSAAKGGSAGMGGKPNGVGGCSNGSGGGCGRPGGAGGEGGDGGSGAQSTSGGAGENGGAGGQPWTSGGSGAAGSGGEGGAGTEPVFGSVFAGVFAPLGAYTGIQGSALLVRTLAGGTQVSLQVTGLTASTLYPAHVHAAPCAQAGGGGHYKRDPSVADTVEANELWLPFTTDAAGVGVSWLEVLTHAARGDALSVVVHDPSVTGAPKMACADLVFPTTVGLAASGTFASFAQAEAIDATIAGTASLTRAATSSHVEFAVSGLDATATYSAHIHALPCSVTAAGGHYKRDTTISATDEANELWVALGATSTGSATGSLDLPHSARLDAQSMVIHRSSSGTALKVACADLPVKNFGSLGVHGTGVAFPVAAERGYPALAASATMVRSLDATTEFNLTVSGLTEHSVYPTHVHNLPCALQSGGGHYKRDASVTATVESNEFWLPFTADHTGGGTFHTLASGIPRAEARSIVIHDSATDAARLTCIDLTP